MRNRVLVLGPPGSEKRTACEKLANYCEERGKTVSVIDFDKEYISKSSNFTDYLHDEIRRLYKDWQFSWGHFKDDIAKNDQEIVLFCLHGCYVTGHAGVRSVLDITKICTEFSPDLVVTLFDDLYYMGSRTKDHILSPTLEQLLMARRMEATLGDMIRAHMVSQRKDVPHITISVNHPVRCLYNLVVECAAVTYMSFPISEPRREAEKGDDTFINMINDYHQLCLEKMKEDESRCFISPLTIDEIPFTPEKKNFTLRDRKSNAVLTEEEVSKVKKRDDEKKLLYGFDVKAHRWPLKGLWGEEPLLSTPVDMKELDYRQVIEVEGAIVTDVGWRDRRLTLQSADLGVYCPKPKSRNEITNGVRNEMAAAAGQSIRINVWQQEDWDVKEKIVYTKYGRPGEKAEAGTMDQTHEQMMTKTYKTVEEMISAGGR